MRALEIGPGKRRILPGCITTDCTARDGVDVLSNWGHVPLPFKDGEFDLVYACHVLEHVPWWKTQTALKDVLRILKPGGCFEVHVPDFNYIIQCYFHGACGDDWRKFNPDNDPMVWVNGRIFTHGPNDDNIHRACFDKTSLRQHLTQAGFINIGHDNKPRTNNHGRINLPAIAYKP